MVHAGSHSPELKFKILAAYTSYSIGAKDVTELLRIPALNVKVSISGIFMH